MARESSRCALIPSNPSSNTWNRPQGPAPTMTTSVWMVMERTAWPSGATGVRVCGGMVVLAIGRQLGDQALELLDPRLGGADRQAVLAGGVAAGLPRIQPVLPRPGQQAVGDIPKIGVLVLVRQLVA